MVTFSESCQRLVLWPVLGSWDQFQHAQKQTIRCQSNNQGLLHILMCYHFTCFFKINAHIFFYVIVSCHLYLFINGSHLFNVAKFSRYVSIKLWFHIWKKAAKLISKMPKIFKIHENSALLSCCLIFDFN